MKIKVILLALITQIFLVHSVLGYEFEKTARLKVFNQDTAMLLIFGEYNIEHQGTLIPVKKNYTNSWNRKEVHELARPILCVTYNEGDIKKGVIVIERQLAFKCHACTAIISVYVFMYNGSEWVFENGKKEVTDAGAWGEAPGCELIKIGDRKYGILFEGSYSGQGTTDYNAFIIAISESEPYEILSSISTGGNNGGQCSDDEKERKKWGVPECYGYECKLNFLKQDNTDYYVMDLKCEGTDHNYDTYRIEPAASDQYYRIVNGVYKQTDEQKYKEGELLKKSEIYNIGNQQPGRSG
jgi:hypothetical protein